MMRVGFVGLGAMGMPMSRNLLRAGYALRVYSRRPEVMRPLEDAGAIGCSSPAEVAAGADVVFTMVTDTDAVEAVTLGANGVASSAPAGCVVIDHSTIDPEGARRIAGLLAERGIEMLDAPVSGGVLGAEAGSLVTMVGGKAAVLAACQPVIAVNAPRIIHMGPSGTGQVAKACNQMCIVVNQMGVAEAMLVAERAGLEPQKLIEALQGGFAASRVLELQGPKMAARDFTGRIESRLHDKDIRIALELAQALGVDARASAVAADALDRLQQRDGGKLDSAAVFTVVETKR